jgi:hypothetical protein
MFYLTKGDISTLVQFFLVQCYTATPQVYKSMRGVGLAVETTGTASAQKS